MLATMKKLLVFVAALASLLSVSTALAAGGAGGAGGAGADLQISGSVSTGSPSANTPFTYSYLVKNSGPAAAAGTVFSDVLPSGFVFNAGSAVDGFFQAHPCSAIGSTVTCSIPDLPSGSQATVALGVTAGPTAGTFANTGSVASSTADPNLANNSVTTTVKVGVCSLPAGDQVNGLIMQKFTNAQGLFENFTLENSSGIYSVTTNFYDGTRPLTKIINLACKPVTTQFAQSGNFVTVVGPVTSTGLLPGFTVNTFNMIASVIQVPFTFDKI
jgi:uncharacterized repeat protein (TIGR01451 family)